MRAHTHTRNMVKQGMDRCQSVTCAYPNGWIALHAVRALLKQGRADRLAPSRGPRHTRVGNWHVACSCALPEANLDMKRYTTRHYYDILRLGCWLTWGFPLGTPLPCNKPVVCGVKGCLHLGFRFMHPRLKRVTKNQMVTLVLPCAHKWAGKSFHLDRWLFIYLFK